MPRAFNIGYYLGSHFFRIFCWGALLGALALITWGEFQWRLQLQSLQWPKVTGTMMQAGLESRLRSSGRSSRRVYYAAISYTYVVDDKRYVSHQIKLWNPQFEADREEVRAFLADYHVRSFVDVYYDPQRPEQAVLVPGADEVAHLVSRCGGIAMMLAAAYGLIGSRKVFSRLPAPPPEVSLPRPKVARATKPFLTYEPADKRKLNCFPDKETLLDALGHEGHKTQDWKSDDRAIDCSGHTYRLIYRPQEDHYDLEPTGETWDWPKLLGIALEDARLLKRDPEALRQRVARAPEADKIQVLVESISEFPAIPWWGLASMFGFLLLFGLVVFYGGYQLFTWFMARWPEDYTVKSLGFVVALLLTILGIRALASMRWKKPKHAKSRTTG